MPRNLQHWLGRVLPRAFWALLVAIHAPLVAQTALSIGQGDLAGPRWAALAVLLPTTAFFVLKLIDVPWLRWRGRPGAWIAFLLICAIAHHEAVATASEDPLAWQAVSLVTTVGVIHAARRGAARWNERLLTLLAVLLPPPYRLRLDAVCADAAPPQERHLRSTRPPRAPPC